ncbi:MAG: acyltransferase family protein [Steroidobacterales bacterium]
MKWPAGDAVTSPYRRDIDGLRGIAVALVVLFHSHVPGFGGGYVGVDVFFVISGYLITLLLIGSSAQPLRARLANFYLRRARRILPALLVVSLIAAAAASIILLPWALARFGKYLAATALLLTNIAAWTDRQGYFQNFGENVALLHFWSIAIEEQFYLIYPISLLLISRYLPRHPTPALLVLAAASFTACVWASYHRPVANYYLAPSRSWELLLGAAIATGREDLIRSRFAGELLAIAALVTLGSSAGWYSAATRYPGLYTLAPCAATAALILTGRQRPTLAARLLSLRPLVFTGLISYSLYLWHFVILALFTYYYILKVSAAGVAALIGSMYIVACLSWKWVEAPIRRRTLLKSNRSFLLWALTANAMVLIVGVALWKTHGLPGRFPSEFQTQGELWKVNRDDVMQCLDLPPEKIATGELCSFGPQSDAAPRALVWGDSHAMALLSTYEKLANSHQIRLFFAANSSCRPLLGVADRALPPAARLRCADFNAAAVQAIRRLAPAVVILNARWMDVDANLVPQPDVPAAPGESNLMRGLQQTLRAVTSDKRSICVVLDVPTYAYDLPYALAVARKRGISEDFLQWSQAEARQQLRGPETDFRTLERRGVLTTVDPKDLLCRTGWCIFEAHGQLLYADSNHLTWTGALMVASVIDGCFRAMTPTGSKQQ